MLTTRLYVVSTKETDCTNSIDHKEMTNCAEDQIGMDLVDILRSYCTNSMLPHFRHKNTTTICFGDLQVFFEFILDAEECIHRLRIN